MTVLIVIFVSIVSAKPFLSGMKNNTHTQKWGAFKRRTLIES